MKNKQIFAGLMLLSGALSAQEVISTQGGSYSNGSNTIDFTIGEPVIETVSGGSNELTQGFHQTLLTITGIEDFDVNFSVNIFPNPTSEFIYLKVEQLKDVSYNIYDATGKLLWQEKLTGLTTKVNVSDLPKGIYFIALTQKGSKKIKTFKIIKN